MKQHDLQKKKKFWSSLLRRTFYRVHACDGVVASNVASAQEVSGVAVERRVRLSMCHERCDGSAHALQRPSRTPLRLEYVEAHFSRFEVHVGVEDARAKRHRGSRKRVRVRDAQQQVESPACVRRVARSSERARPREQVIVARREYERGVLVARYFLELLG